jgi:hypothetical protein
MLISFLDIHGVLTVIFELEAGRARLFATA